MDEQRLFEELFLQTLPSGARQVARQFIARDGGIVQSYEKIKQNVQGDPRQIIQQLLDNGMSQQDYNFYKQMASDFEEWRKK